MHPNSPFMMRLLCLLAVLFTFSTARTQDVLVPKWTASQARSIQYSSDGSRFLVDRGASFSVYDASEKIIGHSSGNAGLKILSHDGKYVYYVGGGVGASVISRFQISDGTTLSLPGINEDLVTLNDVSLNDRYLSCMGHGSTTIIYDLENQVVLCHQYLGLYFAKFLASNDSFIGSNYYQFDLNGNVIKPNNGGFPQDVTFSPDRLALYGQTDTNPRYLVRTNLSNLHKIWSRQIATYISSYTVSSDGSALFRLEGPSVIVTSATTGADVATLALPKWFGADITPLGIFPIPNSKSFFVPFTANAGNEVGLAKGTFDSATTSGNVLIHSTSTFTTLADGSEFDVDSVLSRTFAGTSYLLDRRYAANSSFEYIDVLTRSSTTGAVTNLTRNAKIATNPDGTLYAEIVPGTGLCIRSTLDAHIIATTSVSVGASQVYWQAVNQILVVDSHWSGTKQYQFDGTTVFEVAKTALEGRGHYTSPDGSMVADMSGRSIILKATSTGTQIKKFAPTSATSHYRNVGFTRNNLLMLQDYDDPVKSITMRIYDVSGVPRLLRTISVTYPRVYDSLTAISPGGSYVAVMGIEGGDSVSPNILGSVKVYRISDGALIRDWQNQYLSLQMLSLVFSDDEFVLTWKARYGFVIAAVVPASLKSISLDHTSLPGGSSALATITLNRVVNQDTVVHPSVSTGLVSVPSSVTVPSGASTATFSVTTHGVGNTTTIPIKCTYNGETVSANLTLNPATALSVSLDKTAIEGVGTATGTITLNATAPSGGLSVKVTSSKTSSATVSPATVLVLADSTTGTFTVTTKNAAADYLVTLTAKAPKFSGTVNLMVAGLKPLTLSLDETTIMGGDTASLTITRSVAAPTGGLTYQLSSDSASLIPPTTIVLPEGQATASVAINTLPVAVSTLGTITLNNGSQVKTIAATVIPPVVTTLSSNPTDVTGNGSIDVTITFNGMTPAGFTVNGSSNAAAIVVPASISIPAGQTSYVLTLPVKKVTADRIVTITIGGKTVNVTLHKP